MTSLLLAWIDIAATTKSAFWIGKYHLVGNTLLTESTITVLYLGPVTKSGTKFFSLFFKHYVKVNLRYFLTEYCTKYSSFFKHFLGAVNIYQNTIFTVLRVGWPIYKFHVVLLKYCNVSEPRVLKNL